MSLSLDLTDCPTISAAKRADVHWTRTLMRVFGVVLVGILLAFFFVYWKERGWGGASWLLTFLPPFVLLVVASDWAYKTMADTAVRLDVGDQGVSLVLTSGRVRRFRSGARGYHLELVDGRAADWGGKAPPHPRIELRTRARLEAYVPEASFEAVLDAAGASGMTVQRLPSPPPRLRYRSGVVVYRLSPRRTTSTSRR